MTSPIGGISFPSFTPPLGGVTDTAGTSATSGVGGTSSSSGGDFASMLADSLDQLQATQSNADSLATQAATGNLKDVSDYMIASNEASLATETVVTLKNQAVSAFNEIMRMPV
jgi:flagellar hook-basal body complex protein FliE